MSTTVNTPNPQEKAALEKVAAKRSVKDLLLGEQFKTSVSMALPKHLTVDRFVRVALNATLRNPDLLKCTQDSLFKCLLDLSAIGLEPDGRRAHLIPFNNKVKYKDDRGQDRERWELQCTLIVDYKGLAELVRRSGDVSYIHADVVYEKDTWDFEFGSGAFLKHKPNLVDRGERVIAVYSFVKLRDGSEDFIVLSKSDVEKVHAMAKSPNSPAWTRSWDEMAKKTAFRRHSKWLPLSPENRDAIEKDDDFTGADFDGAIDIAVESAQQGGDVTDEGGGGDSLKDRIAKATSEQKTEPAAETKQAPTETKQDHTETKAPAAETKQEKRETATTAAPIPEFESMSDLQENAPDGDAIGPKLGLAIKINGALFTRQDTSQTWTDTTKAKARGKRDASALDFGS